MQHRTRVVRYCLNSLIYYARREGNYAAGTSGEGTKKYFEKISKRS